MTTFYGPASMSDPADFNDMVNAPQHYLSGGLEAITVIEAFGLGFRLGNAVKYILRAGKKGSRLEDLRKARWYVDREIVREEAAQTSPCVNAPQPPPAMHPTGSFSNAGMDAARKDQLSRGFSFGQSVATEGVPNQPTGQLVPPHPETADNHEINLGPGPHINAPY